MRTISCTRRMEEMARHESDRRCCRCRLRNAIMGPLTILFSQESLVVIDDMLHVGWRIRGGVIAGAVIQLVRKLSIRS